MKIVFVSLDTLRASRMSSYGYEKKTSPHLDLIASQGVLFEKCYAADIPTEVAHTGIFTGKVGLTTGVVSHGSRLQHLPKSVEWLPSMLNNYGMTTAAVDNLYQLKEWFARGYRYYINTKGKERWIDGKTVNHYAKSWIAEHKDEDFFLFLHYWDPHTPYLPPEQYISEFYDSKRNPYDRNNRSMDPAYGHVAYPFFKNHSYRHMGPVTDSHFVNALYDAEVRYLDDCIQELDLCLAQNGIKEDTLLILFGDHGESLTEHGIYWDHCGLYEPTVHVPLIMRWPGQIPAAHRVKGMVQQVDIMPTVLETVGLEPVQGVDGKSLWPLIHGKQDASHDTIYLSECAWQASRGIRSDEYKFIRTYDSGPFSRPPRELYRLNDDPEEINNLADIDHAVANRLESELDQWVQMKLNGQQDPMLLQLQTDGLPFRQRIGELLEQVGLTWDEWRKNPDREKYDALFDKMNGGN